MPDQSTAGCCLQAADWPLQALGPAPQNKDSALTPRLLSTYFYYAQFLHNRHQTWHKLVFGRRSCGVGWSAWGGLCHGNQPDHLVRQMEHGGIFIILPTVEGHFSVNTVTRQYTCPVCVCQSTSVSCFKSSLKTVLFSKTFFQLYCPAIQLCVCVCVCVVCSVCYVGGVVCVCMCVCCMFYMWCVRVFCMFCVCVCMHVHACVVCITES